MGRSESPKRSASESKRYECPRCGAGVKPSDHQCHRCGEILDRTPAMREGSLSKSCSLRSMTKDGFYISKYGSIDLEERREELEEYGRALRKRDSEIREREARIERVYAQMEEDAAALEEAMDEMEVRERALESAPPRTEGIVERQPLDIEAIVAEARERIDASVRAPIEEASRLVTGDQNLDRLLGGGIPKGHLVMVSGGPGTMKTSITMLIASKLTGRRILYVSMEQAVDSLWRQADGLGIHLDRDLVSIRDMDMVRYATQKHEGDWRELVMEVIESMMPFDVLVMDSLDAYRAIVGQSLDRRAIRSLFDRISDMGVTTLLITGSRRSDADDVYLADGVVQLEMREIDGMRVQRWMRCIKMRGNDMDPRYHSFTFEEGRLRLSIPMASE